MFHKRTLITAFAREGVCLPSAAATVERKKLLDQICSFRTRVQRKTAGSARKKGTWAAARKVPSCYNDPSLSDHRRRHCTMMHVPASATVCPCWVRLGSGGNWTITRYQEMKSLEKSTAFRFLHSAFYVLPSNSP